MTNEELDRARVDEAFRVIKDDATKNLSLEVARLAREGWTPPVAVDPDLEEAEGLRDNWENDILDEVIDVALAGIKRGRELERAEAKPGMVWVKHDGSSECPVDRDAKVLVNYKSRFDQAGFRAEERQWENVTHYCEITQPEEK